MKAFEHPAVTAIIDVCQWACDDGYDLHDAAEAAAAGDIGSLKVIIGKKKGRRPKRGPKKQYDAYIKAVEKHLECMQSTPRLRMAS